MLSSRLQRDQTPDKYLRQISMGCVTKHTPHTQHNEDVGGCNEGGFPTPHPLTPKNMQLEHGR